MTLNSPQRIFGFEAQPNNPRVEKMRATYYDAQGNKLGAIDLTPSGYFGALLFAVSSDTPIKIIDLTDLGPTGRPCPTCDFAIANVRFSPNAVPEPTSFVLLGIGLAVLARLRTRVA
jgi:hypothetical protein